MTEIKEAELSSVDAIVGIENSSFTCPWSEKSFNDAISSDKIDVYTIETDGEICGFYCLMIINEEAELLNIAVAASHRRQGLGDKLMTHALSLAKSRGVKAVYLEVRESNTPARRLYEKYGYIALGVRKNYYAYPRENAVIMQKQL